MKEDETGYGTIFRHLWLSLFLTNCIKHQIRIEGYKACRLEDLSDCSRLECQVLESLKRKEKLKLTKFLISQPDSLSYCFRMILFKRLRYSDVKRLRKVY